MFFRKSKVACADGAPARDEPIGTTIRRALSRSPLPYRTTIRRALTWSPLQYPIRQRAHTDPRPEPRQRHRFVPIAFVGSSPALFATAARLDALIIEACFVLTPMSDGGAVRIPLRYRVADHVSVVRAREPVIVEKRVCCEISTEQEIVHAWVVVADAPAGPRQIVTYAATAHAAFARLLVPTQ